MVLILRRRVPRNVEGSVDFVSRYYYEDIWAWFSICQFENLKQFWSVDGYSVKIEVLPDPLTGCNHSKRSFIDWWL